MAANGSDDTIALSYDATGRLTRAVHNGESIDYLYDGDELVVEYSSDARFRFTGQILIPGTELYYYKARVYHPRLGR
ncbi:hypothetical protein J6I90_08990 [Pseudidiomarina sp. 1APP75-32.1]|uniref:Uncharacterized protein n=1 Tax=Pseudidiomarina terrestris TaxID=2820060 RepID=A0AAW7R144_9GAMM|nr:hypothetical protein [Pseudidiomarina sp. 1APP75-32.1]MDN7129507.1 hypothetical protein [Pseudidiomarina sp. 1APR75-15]